MAQPALSVPPDPVESQEGLVPPERLDPLEIRDRQGRPDLPDQLEPREERVSPAEAEPPERQV